MKINSFLRVNGNAEIVDTDDDGPLIVLNFHAEATMLSDDARLRVATATQNAMVRELSAAGVLVPEAAPEQNWERFFLVTEKLPAERDGAVIAKLSAGAKVLAFYDTATQEWKCAAYDSSFYRYLAKLDAVVSWRYKAGK